MASASGIDAPTDTMDKAAVSNDGLVIPLIDLGKFLHGSAADRTETAQAILAGFQTAGFIYLKNTPISSSSRKAAFAASARFFELPMDKKEALGWTTPEANRGYTATGREKVTQLDDPEAVAALKAASPDLKESIEIGREGEAGCPNQWPDETDPATQPLVAGFRAEMMDFFAQCKAVHEEVMRAIAVGMGLPATFFDPFVDVGDNTLRLLHYPAVPHDVFAANPLQVRAGEHSDYGSITLLFQDDRGGLQVRSPHGNFVDATPIPDTIVVNAGDLLARWSNDTIKSTLHRVVEPPTTADVHPPRYSIAYFCNPNFQSFIDVLPGTFAAETEKKYQPVTTGAYIAQRLAATY